MALAFHLFETCDRAESIKLSYDTGKRALEKMLQYMETVSQGEAENIRKMIQDLFRQTCILQVKCDPVTLVQRDNPRYQVCLRHREFIADYLSVLDCELVHDPQEHIFRITGDGVISNPTTSTRLLPTDSMSFWMTKCLMIFNHLYYYFV